VILYTEHTDMQSIVYKRRKTQTLGAAPFLTSLTWEHSIT